MPNEKDKITTRQILLGVTIMIGILVMAGMISMVIIAFEGGSHVKIEWSIGGVTASGMAALALFSKKFMDTRSTQERDEYKIRRAYIRLSKYQSKLNFKQDKYRIKHGVDYKQ